MDSFIHFLNSTNDNKIEMNNINNLKKIKMCVILKIKQIKNILKEILNKFKNKEDLISLYVASVCYCYLNKYNLTFKSVRCHL